MTPSDDTRPLEAEIALLKKEKSALKARNKALTNQLDQVIGALTISERILQSTSEEADYQVQRVQELIAEVKKHIER